MRTKSTTATCVECDGPVSKHSKSGLCLACSNARKVSAKPPPNPSGLCMCGCGQSTNLSPQSNTATGDVRGQPLRYIKGHQTAGRRKPGPLYIVTDCGFQSPCWVWQRKIAHGYAYETVNRKAVRAARLYYERYVGPIPHGLEIDHLCRNRACVNPDHLEPVSRVENERRKPHLVLSIEKAREIRRLYPSLKMRELAEMFGTGEGTISAIINNRLWIEDPS